MLLSISELPETASRISSSHQEAWLHFVVDVIHHGRQIVLGSVGGYTKSDLELLSVSIGQLPEDVGETAFNGYLQAALVVSAELEICAPRLSSAWHRSREIFERSLLSELGGDEAAEDDVPFGLYIVMKAHGLRKDKPRLASDMYRHHIMKYGFENTKDERGVGRARAEFLSRAGQCAK